MLIVVKGLNHYSAPLAVREKFALPENALGAVSSEIRQRDNVREALMLCTCNRTELYVRAPYLQGVDDPWSEISPHHMWDTTLTSAEIRKLGFEAFNGSLLSVEVTEKTPDGRAKTVAVRLSTKRSLSQGRNSTPS